MKKNLFLFLLLPNLVNFISYEKNYDFARSCRHDRQLLHRFVWFDQRSFGLEQKCIQQMGQ